MWINAINEESGTMKDYSSRAQFARAYLKSSFDFVVKNFSYDHEGEGYVHQFTGPVFVQKYKERFNLERFIREGKGVCKQFASLLCLLTTTNLSNLQKAQIELHPAVMNCHIHCKNGRIDPHSLNVFNWNGNVYFCDPTMQHNFPKQDFFIKTKAELQQQYNLAEGARIKGECNLIELKPKEMEHVYPLLSNFSFYKNKDCEDYRTSTLQF